MKTLSSPLARHPCLRCFPKNGAHIWAIFLLFFFFPCFAHATNRFDVVINEIAWMGTATSPNDEWIELYNNTGNSINLDGWRLIAQDGTPKINLSGVISSNGFYLLERTDDNTVPATSADKIYTGALSNNGENLELYDASENLIDSVNCASGWFAGGKKTWQTMERKNAQLTGSDSDNWQTSQNPGGTPKAKNSIFAENEIVDVNPQQSKNEPELKQEEPKPIIYPAGIVINEILPSPEGADADEEWIELKNRTGNDIDISGWKIQDINGSVTTYIIPEKTIIAAQGFFLLPRPVTKITLNNDEDGLTVLHPDGSGADKMTYKKAIRNQSYNNTTNGWLWSETLTPLAENIISEKLQKKNMAADIKPNNMPTVKKSPMFNNATAARAAVAPQKTFSSGSSFIFLTALLIAFFSAAIMLFVKKRLDQ